MRPLVKRLPDFPNGTEHWICHRPDSLVTGQGTNPRAAFISWWVAEMPDDILNSQRRRRDHRPKQWWLDHCFDQQRLDWARGNDPSWDSYKCDVI